jgi:hypothetical protein
MPTCLLFVFQCRTNYYPEYSGIDPGLPSVPQEAHSEEASIKENVREAEGEKLAQLYINSNGNLYSLRHFCSGALGRYAQFGRDFAFGW